MQLVWSASTSTRRMRSLYPCPSLCILVFRYSGLRAWYFSERKRAQECLLIAKSGRMSSKVSADLRCLMRGFPRWIVLALNICGFFLPIFSPHLLAFTLFLQWRSRISHIYPRVAFSNRRKASILHRQFCIQRTKSSISSTVHLARL